MERRAHRTATGAVLAALLVLVGCGGDGPAPAADAAAGKRVFVAAGCGGCHVFRAAGTTGTAGPDLDAARLPKARVLAQLRRPTGVMPAFAGRLSARELDDVAAFVTAGAAPTATTETPTKRFRPDRRRLGDCAERDVVCVEQAFANLAFSAGPRGALRTLEQHMTRSTAVAAACHRVAHRMGSAALARFRGRVGPAFAAGSAVCASGYYHGIIEHAFLGRPANRLAGVARSVCRGKEIAASRFLGFQCLHGLGHGLMLYTGYDLPGALRTCDGLPAGFDRVSCSGGAFMENFTTSYGVTSRYVRAADPIYPCNASAARHKAACYGLVTANLLRVTGGDLARTAAGCRRSEPGWVRTCFESFGRDVSGISGRDAARARAGCRLAEDHEGDCLYGVVREIANADAGPARAARFCAGLAARHRDRCHAGIGTLLAPLTPDARSARAACARLGRRALVPCLRGAGLRPRPAAPPGR